jgi:transposase
MTLGKSNTKCAGIDVGKRWLDVAVHGGAQTRVANDEAGMAVLIAWLEDLAVTRVGMEATAGYERPIRSALEAAGFEVAVHQPLEVKLFARLKRIKAKSDGLDSVVIAAATAQLDAVKAAADPRLQELADRFTAYEQITDQLAQLKTFMEHVTLKDVARSLRAQIRNLERLKAAFAAQILERIKAHADLAERLKLVMSLPGVGPIVGAALIVRMPELGQMKRGQAASLLGVAPFDRDSGQFKGMRFIGGGRRRPRRLVYLAAIAAKRFDPSFKARAELMVERGKPAKVVIVALMRRLIEAANLVLARRTPWQASHA